jgi:pantetheine-phosphate adenylyltransferase
MKRMFETVAVGGTFDLLHSGHLALLKKAFEVGDYVLIGLTSEDYVKNSRKPHGIGSYNQRLEELKNFLERNGFVERAKIMPLTDAYGVTLSDINEKRKNLGLASLPIIIVKMVLSDDHYPISSTRIWFEEIDRDGNLL